MKRSRTRSSGSKNSRSVRLRRTGGESAGRNNSSRIGEAEQHPLCSRCAEIERQGTMQSFLRERYVDRNVRPELVKIGRLDFTSPPTCPLCQLFLAVASPRVDDTRSSEAKTYSGVPFFVDKELWGFNGNVLVVTSDDPEHPQQFSEGQLESAIHRGGAIAAASEDWSVPPSSAITPKALPIQVESINFAQIRHWIDSCAAGHEKCKRRALETPQPVDLKLIDCTTRRIVENQSFEYLALSYVWGLTSLGPQPDLPLKDECLPDELFPTIEDAITVTTKLGFRYIWIDRYCIDQQEGPAKQLQIGQMNLIYRHAIATLTATAGDSPRHGLPGVGSRPRVRRVSARVGNICYVPIANSKAEDPAQPRPDGDERSYRSVFYMVSFNCSMCYAIESVCHLKPDGSSYASEDKDDGKQQHFEILSLLSQYSGKQLTRGSDAIMAVAGVFNDTEFTDGPTPHYLGIPIVCLAIWSNKTKDNPQQLVRRRPTDAFLIGLSWQNREPGPRRQRWPSWAWAEWSVPFDYGRDLIAYETRNERTETFAKQISWHPPPQAYIERTDGSVVNFNDEHVVSTLHTDTLLTHFIRIYSWTCHLDVQLLTPVEQDAFRDYPLLFPPEFEDEQQRGSARFFGTFRDPAVDIKIPLWPMHRPSYERDASGGSAQAQFAPGVASGKGTGGGVLGVVLSRIWLSKSRWLFVMMLLHDRGSHYERVGHCSLYSEDLRRWALKRRLVDEEAWGNNHHIVKMWAINNTMDDLMQWRTVRIG